ncbi:hypothetical protein HanRHA438_Chr07g0326461 [Helianthus annuus]|nr:hypothetical protein HanRHA438_Chr07g0326461 [Helianthus annuus]
MCVGSLSPVRSPCISKTDDETVHSVFNDMVSSNSDNSSQLPSRWASYEADAMDEDDAGFTPYPFFNSLIRFCSQSCVIKFLVIISDTLLFERE